MFDGPTSEGVELDAPIVVLDLLALHGSAAMGVLMVCVSAWLSGAWSRDARQRQAPGGARRGLGGARRPGGGDLPAALLEARALLRRGQHAGDPSPLGSAAAGDEGSREAKIAQGLLSDSETRIILAQSPADLEATRELVGLTGTEVDHVATLPRGVALWKVGERSFVVEHRLSRAERALVDTDARMAVHAAAAAPVRAEVVA